MSIKIEFTPWAPFVARKKPGEIRRWLHTIGEVSRYVFYTGLAAGKSGRKWRNLPNRSSAPGEFPANQSGRLRGTIKSVVTNHSVTIGSNTKYGAWGAYGSPGGMIKKRKMSEDALKIGAKAGRLGHWVEWSRT